MSLWVRKIDPANWSAVDVLSGADIPADAITNCLKTRSNRLSFWEVDSLDQVDDAVLAIVAAHKHLETFDVVVMDPQPILDSGVDCCPTTGGTPVHDLADTHRELVKLTYPRLGMVANNIVESFGRGHVYKRTEGQLKDLLRQAIASSRLRLDALSESLSKKL